MMRKSANKRVSAAIFIAITVFVFGLAKGKVPSSENVVELNGNRADRSLKRDRRQTILQQSGKAQRITNQKTVYCPNNNDDYDIARIYFEDYDGQPPAVPGIPTKWIAKNDSKDPVVILFVVRDKAGNVATEVSSANKNFFPPHHDNNAILKPGQWRSLDTYEGHFFHLRKVLPNGNLGPIVMQHRVGSIVPMANDENIVVDSVVIDPIVVKDCFFDDEIVANKTQEAASSVVGLSGGRGLRGIRTFDTASRII